MTDFRSRIKKVEKILGENKPSDRLYIEAYKKFYAGIDNGESINALPPLPMKPIRGVLNFATAAVLALSELKNESSINGETFIAKMGKSGKCIDDGIKGSNLEQVK
jgi:hypothetical protein